MRNRLILPGFIACLIAMLLILTISKHLERLELYSSSSKQTASCPTYLFPPRSQEESSAAMESWRNAKNFVLEQHLTFLQKDTLTFHRDKIVSL
jgi:UPF0716 family protein affecting phage T7 exclusion